MKQRLILITALILMSSQLCFSQTYTVRLEEMAAVKYQSLSSPNNPSIQRFNKTVVGLLSLQKQNNHTTQIRYSLKETLVASYTDSLLEGSLHVQTANTTIQTIQSSNQQLPQTVLLLVSRLIALDAGIATSIHIQQQDGILAINGSQLPNKKAWHYTTASLQSSNASKVRVNFLEFSWQIQFNGTDLLSSISTETFDQFFGAKQLASVHRTISVEQTSKEVEFRNFATPFNLQPFKSTSEEERRQLINQSIAKNLDLQTLIKELYQTNLSNSESAFRLKSKWRAFLMLHPTLAGIDSVYNFCKTDPRKRTVLMTAILEASTPLSRSFIIESLHSSSISIREKEEWLTTCSQVAQPDSLMIADLKNASALLPLELQNTCWLTVSNLIQKLSSKNRERFHFFANQVANELIAIDRFQNDTAAYMQIMGNMGYIEDWKKFEAFFESNKDEAIFCLRHCQQDSSQQFLIQYMADSSCNDELIASYFQNHEISPKIYTLIFNRIVHLDRIRNTGSSKLLNLLLEKRWTSQLKIETLLNHNFELKENREIITAYLSGLFNYDH